MSGFEVAGVILGSIPLIISALKHYAEGVTVMRNMKEYEHEFSDIQISFSASVAIFSNSCYQLLGPLNLSDRQMNALLVQRSAEAWNAPELQKDLERQLDPHHKIYSALISKLNRRILLFCKKLKLRTDLTPPWVNHNGDVDERARRRFFNNIWTRVQGGFNFSKYTELLQSIDNDIAKINQLTTGGVELEPLRLEQQSRICSTYWNNIRHQAQRLFESLHSRFYPCSCHQPHKAKLRLDPRESDISGEAVRFTFLFTFERPRCGTVTLPWDWRNVEIETSPCSNALADPVAMRSVGFVTTTSVPPRPNRVVSPVLSTTDTTPMRSGLTLRIDNLCGALIQGYDSKCCIGYLEDQSWQHHVYYIPVAGSSYEVIELAPIKDVIFGNDFNMTTIDKCALAFTLASSVLQLHDTPWLPMAWSSNDIFMLRAMAGSTSSLQFYVSRTFDSSPTQGAIARRRRCVKNETVFALGVALLELSYRQPLHTFKTLDDLNEDEMEDDMTEVSIATRLADRMHEREMDNYARAVLRCIRCSFDTFSCDFEDQNFREKFSNAVVTPLRTDYEYVTAGYR